MSPFYGAGAAAAKFHKKKKNTSKKVVHFPPDSNVHYTPKYSLIGRKVSNYFYKYVLVYVFEQFSNPAISQLAWISNYCIDFRAVEKMSTYPVTGNNCTDYAIALSLNDTYPNYYIWKSPSGAKKITGMSENKLKIFISNDKETASKLKKAKIIHLGSLYNITIMDGDMFQNLYQC